MGLLDALSGITDSGNHDSILGAIGKPIQKWTDPLSWMTGGKWADWTSTDIPRASNQVLSKVVTPFDRVDETINPVRRYVPGVDKIGDVVRDKPASAIGTVVGGIFAAPAVGGAMGIGGAGGAGGAAGGAGAAGGGGGGLGGLFGGLGGGGGAGITGGSAAGYGGGIGSSVLPGIMPGATVGAGTGAGGTFGGALGTGSLTGAAGGTFGQSIGSGGLDWMQMAQQAQKMMNQNQQQQQQQGGQQPQDSGGGGGGNMSGLFTNLMQHPQYGQIEPTAGLLNYRGY